MRRNRWSCAALFFILLLPASYTSGFSEEPGYATNFEFLTGYGPARLEGKGKYRVVPFLFDFNFDLTPYLAEHSINPPGLFAFVVEPFFSYVFAPDRNVEIGNNFAFKIGFLPETSRLQPYFKGGAGPMFMSQHTLEQGTQFNFNDFAGLGLHYFFNKTVAFTLECSFRHISNADIKRPNRGIESQFGLLGISFIF
jgi:hypothetical protein